MEQNTIQPAHTSSETKPKVYSKPALEEHQEWKAVTGTVLTINN